MFLPILSSILCFLWCFIVSSTPSISTLIQRIILDIWAVSYQTLLGCLYIFRQTLQNPSRDRRHPDCFRGRNLSRDILYQSSTRFFPARKISPKFNHNCKAPKLPGIYIYIDDRFPKCILTKCIQECFLVFIGRFPHAMTTGHLHGPTLQELRLMVKGLVAGLRTWV